MYNTPKARIQANGIISDPFNFFRGTWQGDALPPLIFILAMEPFAKKIRHNSKIQGLVLRPEEHKLTMYADDLILYLTYHNYWRR